MDKLYELMDWAEIEAVVYVEEDRPRDILGAKVTPHGILIQGFFPDQEKVSVRVLPGNRLYPMEKVDEEGFFAVLLKGRKIPKYEFVPGGKKDGQGYLNPYEYPCQITEKEEIRFGAGKWYDAYKKLGAHPMVIDDVQGVYFAVWAPNAMRVSVVGDFNNWDGRVCQMNRLDSGIFELFIPNLEIRSIYKYELKSGSGMVYLKSDPYANAFEEQPGDASVIVETDSYHWRDSEWREKNNASSPEGNPMAVYQCSLKEWAERTGDGDNCSYADIAKALAEYVKSMGYTHVELTPVTEYPEDRSQGYEVSGYFAPTSRYGYPKEFMYMVDHLHRSGIGVIIDFVASYFASGYSLLAEYDGTCLYEHLDPRKGIHPAYGTHIFNYGRPEVVSFLLSAIRFWGEKYHVDGVKITDLATMLYLDYHREEGQWIPNIYGSSENLEALDFVRQMNTILHRDTNMFTVAEEMAGGWNVTGSAEDDGLGFDLKWNHDWSADFMNYMRLDPVYRGMHQDELTLSTVNAFCEKYMIGFGKDDVTGPSGPLEEQMPGAGPDADEEENGKAKAANMRLAYGYMMLHPGKKLLYSSNSQDGTEAVIMREYIRDLLQIYKNKPALYLMDTKGESFEWISNLDAERNLLVFLRKTDRKEDMILAVCNFSNVAYEGVRVGVPCAGKYKEILNSDAKKYGGSGVVNPRVKISRKIEADERPDSIIVNIPPLGISVFHVPEEKPRTTNRDVLAARAGKKVSGPETADVKADTSPSEQIKETENKEPKKKAKGSKSGGRTAGTASVRKAVGNAAGGIRDKAAEAAADIGGKAAGAAGGIRDKAAEAAADIGGKAAGAAGGIRDKAVGAATDIKGKAVGAATDIGEKVTGKKSSPKDKTRTGSRKK